MTEQLQWLDSETAPVYVSTRSIQSHLDMLIDWYERHKPGVISITVNCRPATLRKFCRKNGKRGGPWRYRERVIVPVRKPREQAPE